MNKKIFIGPNEIAGYYANLSNGLRGVGVDCDFITYAPHPYGYGGESKTPILIKIARFFDFKLLYKPIPMGLLILLSLPKHLFLNIWALFAIFKYDTFVFGFGSSLGTYKNWDLIILRLLNKKVISHLNHGSEARAPYVDGFIQDKDGKGFPSIEKILRKTIKVKKKVKWISKYSTLVIGAPLSTYIFMEGFMVNTFALGVPFTDMTFNDRSNEDQPNLGAIINSNKIIRILHSPSHPAGKGTQAIEQAIDYLREKGYEIEFIKIHGKKNSEVIDEILKCDFVIDQVYSDFPLAGFATEAAWYGKPAVVGGYGLLYLKSITPAHMWPPSKICHPSEIINAIEDLIVNVDERKRIGVEANQFVRKNWNGLSFASRYKKLIDGEIPSEWIFHSSDITYLEGYGQSIDQTKKNIVEIIEKYGVESLHLSHRPNLEKAYSVLANFPMIERI
jgi:hypothetical protein